MKTFDQWLMTLPGYARKGFNQKLGQLCWEAAKKEYAGKILVIQEKAKPLPKTDPEKEVAAKYGITPELLKWKLTAPQQ